MDINTELKNEVLSAISKLSEKQRAELWEELVRDHIISAPPASPSHE